METELREGANNVPGPVGPTWERTVFGNRAGTGYMDFDTFVLAAVTSDLDEEPAAGEHADAVEFRMDLAADPLDALGAYDGDLPIIATNRAAWEGGGAESDGPDSAGDKKRLEVLEEAAGHPAVEAVDVELAAVESGTAATGPGRTEDGAATIEAARDAGTAVVASVHDFDGTPPRRELEDLLGRAGEVGDVGKLAVTAAGPDDVLDLLGATRAATTAGHRVATMAMGAAGRHSRAVAPIYGSRVGYAPVDPANATAPGQYDLATLAELVERLG